MLYLIYDLDHKEPTKVLVLPYLHERSVNLNKLKPNTKYFYTLVDTQEKLTKGLLESLKDTYISRTTVICMNLTEYKYHVYSTKGALISRIVFKNEVNKYGVPITVSSNGQVFVFKHNSSRDNSS